MDDADALALAAARVNLCLGYEQRMLARNAQQRRLPVTIVSGFLGAGKTSLLHHLLDNRLNLRLACAVSDLAAINVDELLVTDQTLYALQRAENAALNAASAAPVGPAHWKKQYDHKATVFGVQGRGVDDFKDVIWTALQQHDEPFDYLVIETSGTTDPTQLIAAVQQKFGKLTRARLDSVVVVVDGDAVASDARANREPNAVAIDQLSCADVVVLNKIDLLDDDGRALARKVIAQYAPLARVYETQHGQAYLPNVLDIAPPQGIHDAMSHEKVVAHWVCGDDASQRRLRINETSVNGGSGRATDASSAFQSVAYEQTSHAVALGQLHHYIRTLLPRGALRAKGVVHIADDPTHRYVVQLSGKKRLEIDNTGRWLSQPKTQFVVIGTGLDEDVVMRDLETTFSTSVPYPTETNASVAKLRNDERFEIVQELPHAVQFRLRIPTNAIDDTILKHYHHVDKNDMVRRLVHEVNALGGGALLLPVVAPDNDAEDESMVVAVAATTGETTLLEMWDSVDARADVILKEVREKLSHCMCGF